MFVPLENSKYENQNLKEKYQNLTVKKMRMYLIDSLNTYMKHCVLLYYDIVNCLD